MLDWIINTLLKNQISTLGATAGAFIFAHGASAGYTQAQIAGAVSCILFVGLQYGENYFRDRNTAAAHAAALATVPPGYMPVPVPINVVNRHAEATTPVTMKPIPNPGE